EHAFPQRLVRDVFQPVAEGEAGDERERDAPPDGGTQPVAAGLAEVGEDDRDGEERLEAFARDDDDGIEHDRDLPSELRRVNHPHAIGSIWQLTLAAARVAHAEDLQVAIGGGELLLLANLALPPLELRVMELDHRLTNRADEMVVMRVAADVLVVVMIFPKMHPPHEPGLHE